jgi:hypothetical protein
MAKRTSSLRDYAVIGARVRLSELKQELADLYRSFPTLRGGQAASRTQNTGTRKKKIRRSAAYREAVRKRMKAYWAAKKRKKG